jgi:hypothetical protein
MSLAYKDTPSPRAATCRLVIKQQSLDVALAEYIEKYYTFPTPKCINSMFIVMSGRMRE